MKNKSPQLLTMVKCPHKMCDTERRFYFDSQTWKATGREASRTSGHDPIERRRTSKRRAGQIERQASGKGPVVLDCSKDCRVVGEVDRQEVKQAARTPWKDFGRPKYPTGLRQRTLFIVAFLLPLSSQHQLR